MKSAWLTSLGRFLGGPKKHFGIARSVYLRGLGLVYLVAILSWWVQMDGLVGSGGVFPTAIYLEQVANHFGSAWEGCFRQAPSLLWLGGGADHWLHGICAVGAAAALAVIAGFLPGPMLLLLWVVYLSLATTGGAFMNFQWDILLLEVGFLGFLLAPWRLSISRGRGSPSRWIVFLHWWLLFRLMFFSGYVKLASGDLSWESCRALLYHYETQPLPNAVAWYVHQLPEWVHVFSCRVMFGIELVVPFLFFLGRWPRAVGVAATVALMVLIIATGNYTFFNCLTILLCVLLLDDQMWSSRWRLGDDDPYETRDGIGLSKGAGSGFQIVLGGIVFLLSLKVVVDQGNWWHQQRRVDFSWPDWVERTVALSVPYRSVGSYGLFADMTETRPEIVIEGSLDGVEWKAYEFRWKPGDLGRRPGQVAPHQPRLDWQMWFEALAAERRGGRVDFARGGWFPNVLVRLLEGSESVGGLVHENPFEESPPWYVRARLYRYRFTTREEREATGGWWNREYLGDYCPPIERRK